LPTYEYRCKTCGQHLEIVQAFTDDALTECPTCGGDLRKVFGSIGISFKGSGFYKTDSRVSSTSSTSSSSESSSSSGDGGSSSGDGGSSSSGDTTSSGDSKPATPTKSSDAAKSA
jgi:putative FmdB family regulatory protein